MAIYETWGFQPGRRLSGTPVRVFQLRYTIAIVYRLMFFMCRKISRLNPPKAPLSWGIAELCWNHAASIAAQAAVSRLSRYRGIAAILLQIAV